MTEPTLEPGEATLVVVASGTVTHANGQVCPGPETCTYPPHVAAVSGRV